MPFSSLSLRIAGALAVTALSAAVSGADTAASRQNIFLDAASSEVDYKKNTVEFKDIVISQGDIKVEANHAEAEATGLNFKTGVWTFTGDVRIHVEKRGNLRSDQAVVDFKDSQIVKATVTGKPAQFEQQRTSSDQLARGHAGQIVYEPTDGVVRLSNDAWISDGRNEIRGALLVYNIRQQHVEAVAQPGNDERVHITIVPGQDVKPK
ncbi:MAG TPA: lipopolysaccharide transport periplasmic protein LptA [Steroidobacteraceae bacterium]|jgi:lipopolysaccharide transport protein LptA|nr:lipopolysaccharide transport periplasmic protein LptA [Steroidobacteraceae bacterium]